MYGQYTSIFDGIGIMLSGVFLVLIIVDRRSLIGSFFRHYYRFMMGAVVAMLFAFAVDPFGELLMLSNQAIGVLHNFGMIATTALLIYASRLLPRDAAAYMKSKQHE